MVPVGEDGRIQIQVGNHIGYVSLDQPEPGLSVAAAILEWTSPLASS